MECQCAGCYPEREARRKHREALKKLEYLQDLRKRLLTNPLREARVLALEDCDELIY